MTQRYVTGTPDERFDAYLKPGPTMPGMTTPCIEWTRDTDTSLAITATIVALLTAAAAVLALLEYR